MNYNKKKLSYWNGAENKKKGIIIRFSLVKLFSFVAMNTSSLAKLKPDNSLALTRKININKNMPQDIRGWSTIFQHSSLYVYAKIKQNWQELTLLDTSPFCKIYILFLSLKTLFVFCLCLSWLPYFLIKSIKRLYRK